MKVAVAIITKNNQVLITQRAEVASHGGFWEFPGGKLEADESPSSALIREVKEEVDLDVLNYKFLAQIDHNYHNKFVSLLVYHVTHFKGEAICSEGQQALLWVEPIHLSKFTFPEANEQIISLVKNCDRKTHYVSLI